MPNNSGINTVKLFQNIQHNFSQSHANIRKKMYKELKIVVKKKKKYISLVLGSMKPINNKYSKLGKVKLNDN